MKRKKIILRLRVVEDAQEGVNATTAPGNLGEAVADTATTVWPV